MYMLQAPITSATIEQYGGKEKILAEIKRMNLKRVFAAIGQMCVDDTEWAFELEKLKENVDFFHANGLEVGTWICTFWFRDNDNFTRVEGGKGTKSLFVCPLDKNFQSKAKKIICDVAKCGVDIILFEDDYRFGYFAGKEICCTCPLHMEKINEYLGESITPEILTENVLTGGANKYRDAWMYANGDSLKSHAHLLRNAVDSINPQIRLGICSCMPIWDMDGVDTATIAKILAGNTKPYIRLIGAPYWAVDRFYGKSRLQNVIDLERMEISWCSDDMEIVAEGDCFPRPRTTCPASYLELFDMAMRVDGRFSGIMKYSIDFISGPDYEPGYVDAQIKNEPIYHQIEEYFSHKTTVGVRIYEAMNKFRNMNIPEYIKDNENIYDTFFSPASRLLADNSIPSTYEGEGIGSIAFGENIKYVPREVFKKGIIIDARAAMILAEKGIDTGFETIGEEVHSSTEEFSDGMRAGYVGNFTSYKCTLKENAEISSYLILNAATRSATPEKNPFAFMYENADGDKFFVLNLEAYFCSDNILRGYARSKQIKDAIEKMSGKKLPAYSYGNPDLYIMCKESENKKAVGLFNIFADGIYDGTVDLDKEYKTIEFINCKGELKGDKVCIRQIQPFSFAGFEVRN